MYNSQIAMDKSWTSVISSVKQQNSFLMLLHLCGKHSTYRTDLHHAGNSSIIAVLYNMQVISSSTFSPTSKPNPLGFIVLFSGSVSHQWLSTKQIIYTMHQCEQNYNEEALAVHTASQHSVIRLMLYRQTLNRKQYASLPYDILYSAYVEGVSIFKDSIKYYHPLKTRQKADISS